MNLNKKFPGKISGKIFFMSKNLTILDQVIPIPVILVYQFIDYTYTGYFGLSGLSVILPPVFLGSSGLYQLNRKRTRFTLIEIWTCLGIYCRIINDLLTVISRGKNTEFFT